MNPGRMMSDYRVQLDSYEGPMDLLLYLIRREEVDIYDIPIARITEQYMHYLDLLRRINLEVAGEFLVMAASLMEVKSAMLLPRAAPQDGGEPLEDPRAGLVQQLLEYKRFKDLAGQLGQSAEDFASRFARGVPPDEGQAETRPDYDLDDVMVWDLLDAFQRVMAQVGMAELGHEVIYDETPIDVWAEEILARLQADGALPFHALFEGRSSRSELIGLFLALLELVRQKLVQAEQEKIHGTIWLFPCQPEEEAAAPTEAEAPQAPAVIAEAEARDPEGA